MTFLSPWTAVLAAAVAIPILLLLYVLRLRRQRLRIASTLLWQKSFEDLQANAPFQKLRWSVLLVLQLLLILGLLLALAQPAIRGAAAVSPRTVLLIDRSASMSALVGQSASVGSEEASSPVTRLDEAKQVAREMVNSMGRAAQSQQMMIIAFGGTPQIITTYEANRRVLLNAIDSIVPTDEQADLKAALDLASAYSGGSSELDAGVIPEVVLLSDGNAVANGRETEPHRLQSGLFRFVPVGNDDSESSPVDNIGITSFSVSRDFDDPAQARVFVRLANAGDRAVTCVVTIWVNGEQATAIQRTVPPASDSGLGEESLTYALALTGDAVLMAKHNHVDDLESDNTAWFILPAPMLPRIAHVYPAGEEPDAFLHDLLQAIDTQELRLLSDAVFASLDVQQLDAGELFDLVVFDRVAATRLPGVSTITFGAVPMALRREGSETELEHRDATGQRILSWDRQHPLMRNLSLDSLVYSGAVAVDMEQSSRITPMAIGQGGPVIVEFRSRGQRHALVGFEMLKSNWPLHISSAIFMQNAVDYFTLTALGATGLAHRTGDSISIRTRPVTEVVVEGPISMRLTVEPGQVTRLPALRLAGLYTVAGAAPPFDRLAVNVISDAETDIRPRRDLVVSAEGATGARVASEAVIPIWPWLIGAAFALLIVEWLAYCQRARS